jgi:superfamily I DNA and/or RNA helicase
MIGGYMLVGSPVSQAMAEVYKAYDTRGVHGEVAVKLLPIGADDRRRRSFERERKALERLQHPYVVPLLDGGVDPEDDRPFLVFPWLDRRLQDEVADRGPIPWTTWWKEFGGPILSALDAAHQLDIHHRDLKPANILLDSDGSPRVIDFGISKIVGQLYPQATVDGASSPFTPPELVQDSPAMTRDTHAWAALTVFAVSGVDPYPAWPSDPWEELERARQLALAALPPSIRPIVERCLSRDPKIRPQTGGVLVADVERAVERERRIAADSEAEANPPVPVVIRDGASGGLEDELDIYSADADDLLVRELQGPVHVVEAQGQGRYLVITATMSARAALHPDGSALLVTSAGCPPTWVLDRDRERGWQPPMRLRVGGDTDDPGAALAVREFIQGFAEHSAAQGRVATEKRARPFVVWRALLTLLRAHEAANEDPLAYVGATTTTRGGVRFELEHRAPSGLLGEVRVASADGGHDFYGPIAVARHESLIIDPDPRGARVPLRSGTLRRDRRSNQTSIERQQRALDAVEYGRAVRPDLGDLFVNPSTVRAPTSVTDLEFHMSLDDPKQRAVEAALGSEDLLIVRGPPGTGKTTFITELVVQELDRNLDARILLASQSHAALDHALAGLAGTRIAMELVRIARASDERVADSSRELLLDHKVKLWRAKAIRAGQKWLRRWAESAQIDAKAVETAARLGTLAADLRRLERIDAQRRDLDTQVDKLKSESRNASQGATTSQALRERQEEIEELREEHATCADEIKEHIARLAQLGHLPRRTSRSGLSADQLDHEAASLLPTDKRGTEACLRLLNLLNDWQARFGLGPAFRAAILGRAQVVAATCVGLAGQRGADSVDFDLVIVDEASKATAPELLIPLSRGRRFVLVGDDRQLPPYVEEEAIDQNQLAERGLTSDEIKKPLFAALASQLEKTNVVTLTHQHRMHPAIGRLVADCFYPEEGLTSEDRPDLTWLAMLAPRPVTWLTTSPHDRRFEGQHGVSVRNDLEIKVISTFLNTANALAASAKVMPSVAVLTGYAAQRDALESRIARDRHNWRNLAIECHTVDAFQGRQAEIVLYSVTRSNPHRQLGFVKERPRLNVALSRAQDALIVVGDHLFARDARGSQAMRRVLEHIDANPDECTLVRSRIS